MPSSTMESCARICGCWCAGKTSIIRLMVDAAEFVCSVANVKWPVSAMRRADSMVSRSRISPINTTSGSSRNAARSELENECVSACTSRWLTRHFLWLCRNSMGSSMVIMCSSRSLLILSSIAASVVDLPEPVGPVTRISPRGLSQSALTTGGSPSASNPLISQGIVRNTAPTAPRWLNTLPRKRARFFKPNEKSSSRFSSKRCFCASVSTLYASDLVSAAVSGGMSRGRKWPCTRTRGALLVVMWRSLPPISIIFLSNSLSVMPAIACSLSRLQYRLAQNLFHGCLSRGNLGEPAAAQRDHSLLDRLLLQLQGRGADQNQFAQFVINLHHFVQARAAFVAALVAGRTALPVINLHRLYFFGRVSRVNQCLLRHFQLFLAVHADTPHQTLRANQVDRGGHKERLDTHVHQAADRRRSVIGVQGR